MARSKFGNMVLVAGMGMTIGTFALLHDGYAQQRINSEDQVHEELELDYLKGELARLSKAQSKGAPRGDVEEFPLAEAHAEELPLDDLDSKAQKLDAEEAAILAKLSGGNAPLREVKLNSDEGRASADLDRAANEGNIEVVREVPGRRIAAPVAKETSDELEPFGEATSLNTGVIDGQNKKVDEHEMQSLRSTNDGLRTKLDSSDRKVTSLTRELSETRNRLIIAETEVERLSKMIEERNRSSLAKLAPKQNEANLPETKRAIMPVATHPEQQESKMSSDMPIATVVVDKAQLRTGPGRSNSPLMAVSRGTRLAIETRSGSWYRVIGPTGARAWVSSDVLAFGPSSLESPTRTVRIKGYQSDLDEASRIIRSTR